MSMNQKNQKVSPNKEDEKQMKLTNYFPQIKVENKKYIIQKTDNSQINKVKDILQDQDSDSAQSIQEINEKINSQINIKDSQINENEQNVRKKEIYQEKEEQEEQKEEKQKLQQNSNEKQRKLPQSQINNQQVQKNNQQAYYNVQFYKCYIKSFPMGDYIENILITWSNNYEKLERHHGYVQWLFPNYYASRFNNNSHKLLEVEADLFRNDIEIANRLVRSYEMFYDFLGIQFECKETGKLKRALNYKERYHKTFITSWHNHMRITRILSHMNIVGFRRYAIELVKFIEKEMFGSVGYDAYKKNRNLKIDESAPLKDLAKHLRVYEEWLPYGHFDIQDNYRQHQLEHNCMEKVEKMLIPSVFFTQK